MWDLSGPLWLQNHNLIVFQPRKTLLSKSSSESYRANATILIFSRKTEAQRRSVPRRAGARSARGAARLPPRTDRARQQYLARREPQASFGRRILRRSPQSRGRAASHAALRPSRMVLARAQLKGIPFPLRAGPFLKPPASAALAPRGGASRRHCLDSASPGLALDRSVPWVGRGAPTPRDPEQTPPGAQSRQMPSGMSAFWMPLNFGLRPWGNRAGFVLECFTLSRGKFSVIFSTPY